MRWFKHFADNHRGQSIQMLLDDLGHTGLCYYLLLEMCAEKMEIGAGVQPTAADCVFNFHCRVVQQNLRIRPAGLRRLLSSCQVAGLLTFEFSGVVVQISMPILLDLLDRDLKKPRFARARNAEKPRLEKRREEKNREEEINTRAAQPKPANPQPENQPQNEAEKIQNEMQIPAASPPPAAGRVIKRYCEVWRDRYKSAAPISGRAAGQIKTLFKDFGEARAIKLVEAYLSMPDSWFVTKRHDVPTLIANLAAVAHYADTGAIVTKKHIRDLDEKLDDAAGPKRKTIAEILAEKERKKQLQGG